MNSPESSSRVAVVGGGISGLAAAHQLASAGTRVTVFESSSHVGGKLKRGQLAGIAVDAGAESVLARRPEAVDLIRAVGLGHKLVYPEAVGASVWIDDRLRKLPQGQLLGIPYDLARLAESSILDKRGLLRAYAEASLPKRAVTADVAVGQLVRERLGRQVVERLVEPVLGGVYAGESSRLSLDMVIPGLRGHLTEGKSLMSAIQELLASRHTPAGDSPVFASVDGGLWQLPEAVADTPGVDARTESSVTSLRREDAGWEIVVERTGTHENLLFDAVVLACPAQATGQLLATVVPEHYQGLAGVEYASVALVTYAFERAELGQLPEGTGFLVPPVSGRSVKAVTFASQKWHWLQQQNPDRVVIRVSLGRYGEGEVLRRSDDELADVGLSDLSVLAGVSATPLDQLVTRWENALPQYAVGHRLRMDALQSSLAKVDGVEICGAGVDGVGIAACIASGQSAATRVADFLSSEGR
ncbi:MAG TPA: protoporphyrinogen oxidase [Actinomycetes bacterium]|nr:protoporphyrinogen oxidase [Actinomycetes bacterium]